MFSDANKVLGGPEKLHENSQMYRTSSSFRHGCFQVKITEKNCLCQRANRRVLLHIGQEVITFGTFQDQYNLDASRLSLLMDEQEFVLRAINSFLVEHGQSRATGE
jgi:hypothetical protein